MFNVIVFISSDIYAHYGEDKWILYNYDNVNVNDWVDILSPLGLFLIILGVLENHKKESYKYKLIFSFARNEEYVSIQIKIKWFFEQDALEQM